MNINGLMKYPEQWQIILARFADLGLNKSGEQAEFIGITRTHWSRMKQQFTSLHFVQRLYGKLNLPCVETEWTQKPMQEDAKRGSRTKDRQEPMGIPTALLMIIASTAQSLGIERVPLKTITKIYTGELALGVRPATETIEQVLKNEGNPSLS